MRRTAANLPLAPPPSDAALTHGICIKLGARSRTQAVEQARALGLLAPFLSQAPIGGSGA